MSIRDLERNKNREEVKEVLGALKNIEQVRKNEREFIPLKEKDISIGVVKDRRAVVYPFDGGGGIAKTYIDSKDPKTMKHVMDVTNGGWAGTYSDLKDNIKTSELKDVLVEFEVGEDTIGATLELKLEERDKKVSMYLYTIEKAGKNVVSLMDAAKKDEIKQFNRVTIATNDNRANNKKIEVITQPVKLIY